QWRSIDLFTYCFFFSSRRRHTISKRDWSSDVCSSDLCLVFIPEVIFPFPQAADEPPQAHALLYGGSSRPLLPQECQNYPRNDGLFFPLYPISIFIFLY